MADDPGARAGRARGRGERREPGRPGRALAGRRAGPPHLRLHHAWARASARASSWTASSTAATTSWSGEIAFMCMGPQYMDQDFGTRGCLETLASLKALGRAMAARRAGATRGSWVAELLEAAGRGDRPARGGRGGGAHRDGGGEPGLVVDPSLIVLGGALVTQGDRSCRRCGGWWTGWCPPPRDRGLRAGQGGPALGLPAGGGRRGPRAPAPAAPAVARRRCEGKARLAR